MHPAAASHCHEVRQHELRRTRLQMIDGALVGNLRSSEGGTSARVHRDGYWGFASAPGACQGDALERLLALADRHARTMARFGPRPVLALPATATTRLDDQTIAGRPALSAADCAERLAALHAHCSRHYPGLRSTRFMLADERHDKRLRTSAGGESLARIARALLAVALVAEGDDGGPVELVELLSCKGSLADLELSVQALAPVIEQLHDHLQAKRHAVTARGGLRTVVMAAPLTGLLAHEAMGHPCEADIVLGGAVTAGLVGRPVASALVTMVDFAHHFEGSELMIPVYVDDEGVPAQDAVLIDGGQLTGFMHSRETAARMGRPATGNARAYGPGDEPLVRMRNTAVLPGHSSMEQMIAGVDDGVLLLKSGNGQADSTSEFMFGINLAYEIRGGRLGRALRDTTLSGSAIKVLQTVDAVGDQMHWTCAGYCGKKQPMVVSMGGPALRAQAQLGGR